MRCIKCGRRLMRDPGPHGMGPVCARSMLGVKPLTAKSLRFRRIRGVAGILVTDDGQMPLEWEAV